MSEVDRSLPDGYPELLEDLKRTVAAARWHAQRVVNTDLLLLYWQLRDAVLQRQRTEGWGTRVIDRLATDLRAAFPEMRGLSRSNLFYMRSFAASWPRTAIVQQPVGRLPWGHVTVLLDKLAYQAQRDWYAAAATAEHGWSRNVLLHQIMSGLHTRAGAAPSNFPDRLPASDSELAQQLTRDPYVSDFLDLTAPVAERDLETALVDRLQAFLLELGHGFAFVGRQYHVEVDGDDFYIDLLFFNWAQSRFVVLEFEIGRFAPEHLGQLGFYVSWVDANLRRHDHSPTIGVLLCTDRNDNVVRYALASATSPMAVATYTYDTLPDSIQAAVPTDEQLTTALTSVTTARTTTWNVHASVAAGLATPTAAEDSANQAPADDN